MKLSKTAFLSIALFCTALLVITACNKDNGDEFPITKDLRVLQVKSANKVITDGASNLSVISQLDLIFSHGLDASSFESALTFTPAAEVSYSYDDTKSFVAINFTKPMEYDTEYSIHLAKGSYGINGEESIEDFNFNLTTETFIPPLVTLTSSKQSFYEGETNTITASLSKAIALDVNMDLIFSGLAEKDLDYTSSDTKIVIPAGQTAASIELTAITDPDFEGEETIQISIENLENGIEDGPQLLFITMGDLPPALEFKGVMSLKIGGTDTNGRAIHLSVLEDIADLSTFGIGIANNGGGTDGREIDFPAISVAVGEDILLVRDIDRAGMESYFGPCWQEIEHVIESEDVNFNGNDPFELYNENFVIETYGDVDQDGTGLDWEWTGTWAFKLGGVWEYGALDCSSNAATNAESACPYPFCQPLMMEGALALLWDGSGTNGGKGIQLRVNRYIDDLSKYSIGVANNGGGTDGIEFTFPQMSADEGAHILLAREPETIASYFGPCFDAFDFVIQSDAMNQNGDDALELFDGEMVIETFGDANVDGTDQPWEYKGSWGFKIGGIWTYGGIDCAAGTLSTQSSPCPYPFCN
jgi:hypothetical protein